MESIDKLKNIYDGWKNLIFPSEEVEKLAKQRAEICSKCPSNVNNTCKECGCPLISKTRSTKKTNVCPLNKWKNEIKTN